MKLTSTKTCIYLFGALAGLLLMGICPGGGSCSDPDNQAALGHALGQECCGRTPVSDEGFLSFEGEAAQHSNHECCRHCSDFHFHFGCNGVLVPPNQTRSIAFAAFACTGAITNNAELLQNGLPSQLPDTVNAALPLLRTVVLLT
ncbi:MAG: hypothetical protein JXD22_02715 [Sedimentisphaerales bacterium]|nr:hypothetical protein [Sedimentisphaerales bacterium]